MATHVCPGGCGADVAFELFACKDCWFRLPKQVRIRIVRTYRRYPDAHQDAMSAAFAWYADHPLPQPPPPPPTLF